MTTDRLLLVEDDRMINFEIGDYLRQSGFGVAEAFCAADAYRALGRRAPLTALVTDINLGPGDDGFEVARQARLIYPQIRVVYISGAAGHRHPAEGVAGSQLLAKPLHPRQIVEAIRRGAHARTIRATRRRAATDKEALD